MFNKLAGHLSLSEMVSRVIDDSRTKMAADESKDDKKDDKVKKLVDYEKKEHGHVPTPKEEEQEKKASIDFSDPEDIEKLASALETVGDQFIKTSASEQEHGDEYKGGGETLAVMAPVGGKQNYGKDKSKSHNIPTNTPEQKGDGGGPAKTQVENDHAPGKLLKYTKSEYPKSGVLKHASKSVAALQEAMGEMEPVSNTEQEKEAFAVTDEGHKLDAKRYGTLSKAHHDLGAADRDYDEEAPVKSSLLGMNVRRGVHKMTERHMDYAAKRHEKGENALNPFGGLMTKSRHEEKKASAGTENDVVSYILSKVAEGGNVEKRMGGETLDSKSGDGPKPPSGGTNSARSMIDSNAAATNAKKVQAKAPQKKLMAEVLTEPMMSKAHDAKVQENLRNAAKGGVKIAAARELLKKVAEEGCTCDGKGECKYCKMKKAMEKKSMGGMPATGSSMPTSGPMM